MANVRDIKMEELTQFREISQKVSSHLLDELTRYLKTLTPLFSPRKVLGEYMAGATKDKVIGAEKNYSMIEERYKVIMRDAFGFSAKLSSVVPVVSNKITLYNWEYLETFDETLLTISSPTKWVLGFENAVNIKRLLQMKTENKKLLQEEATAFVVSKLVMAQLIDNSPGLRNIVEGLGFKIIAGKIPECSGDLPYVILSAPFESFRPQDELVKMAAQFSGSSSFGELIDIADIEQMSYPKRDHLLAI